MLNRGILTSIFLKQFLNQFCDLVVHKTLLGVCAGAIRTHRCPHIHLCVIRLDITWCLVN